MTLSASLQEMLVSSSDYALSNIYTSIPGVIVTIKNMGQLCVDVQPTVNVRTQYGSESTQRPPILNVPYQQPISTKGGLTFPVSVGDPVWLNFSMRGLEIWKRGNGTPDSPADMRTFDPRDCMATPLYPFGMSPNQADKRSLSHDPSDVVLVHNIGTGSEVEIRLKPNGDVIVNSPATVKVNCKNAEVNAEVDITAIAGESAIVTAQGDSVVNSQGNVSVTNAGWSQLVSSGSVLIKSEEGVKIQGPSGSLTI